MTLRSRLLWTFLAFAGLALLGAALGTATVLHLRARASLDRTLMAAALAEAHPWQEERYDNAYVRSPVQVRLWNPDRPVAPAALHDEALRHERPVWADVDGRRVLLLPVEAEAEREADEPGFVVVATAPGVRLQETVVPFLASYVVVSGVALSIASLLLGWALTRALGPLQRATRSIQQAGALDAHTRLRVDGPPEVQHLLRATNQLLDRLEAAYASQISFTALAAHELRTPLTVLRGEVDVALRHSRDVATHQEVLHRLRGEFERLQALVDGLLLLSRVDAGHVEQGKQIERLSHPVTQALTRERPGLDAAGCTVEVDLSADPELPVHVALATSAFATLLRNVARHAPGSTVRVSTSLDQGMAVVTIADDGVGIVAPEEMVERFGRADGGGLGLGLPLAAEVARRHGGELVLTSDGGTRACVRLPLAAPA